MQIELAAKVVDFLSPQRAEALKLVCAYLSKFCRLHRPWELGLRKPGKGENAHSNVIPTFSKILIYDATNEGNGPHPLRLAASALLKDFMSMVTNSFHLLTPLMRLSPLVKRVRRKRSTNSDPHLREEVCCAIHWAQKKTTPRSFSTVSFSALNEAGMGIIADAGDAVEKTRQSMKCSRTDRFQRELIKHSFRQCC